jgi:hypothetical protein
MTATMRQIVSGRHIPRADPRLAKDEEILRGEDLGLMPISGCNTALIGPQ